MCYKWDTLPLSLLYTLATNKRITDPPAALVLHACVQNVHRSPTIIFSLKSLKLYGRSLHWVNIDNALNWFMTLVNHPWGREQELWYQLQTKLSSQTLLVNSFTSEQSTTKVKMTGQDNLESWWAGSRLDTLEPLQLRVSHLMDINWQGILLIPWNRKSIMSTDN